MNESMPAAFQPRVLHVTSALDPGGIETWLLRIVRHPDGAPLVGGILALSAREGLLAPQFRECGIPIYCLRPANNPLRFIADLAGILRSTGPWHGVHSHVHRRSALVHLASLVARVPLRVTHSHNTKGQETASRNPLRGMLSRWATYCINALSNFRVACSRDAATALFGKRSEEDPEVRCMPYGIDVGILLALFGSARIARLAGHSQRRDRRRPCGAFHAPKEPRVSSSRGCRGHRRESSIALSAHWRRPLAVHHPRNWLSRLASTATSASPATAWTSRRSCGTPWIASSSRRNGKA